MTELLRFRQVRRLTPLGTLTRDENAGRVLQGRRSQERILVIPRRHGWAPRRFAASAVPRTRAWVFAKAVSRPGVALSENAEDPQSRVVPSCSIGTYPGDCRTRARTFGARPLRAPPGAVTAHELR